MTLKPVWIFGRRGISYLSDRFQSVRVQNRCSSSMPVPSGEPQGSVLGPILFSIFINDLPDVLRLSQCHLYADDVQLLASGKRVDMKAVPDHLNRDIIAVLTWARLNKLSLNASKTK